MTTLSPADHFVARARLGAALVALSLLQWTLASAWSAPLPHSAYVWQRSWTAAVTNAVAAHGASFDTIVALGAEVTWRGGKPDVIRVTPDYAVLKQCRARVGLALRIGPFSGPFRSNDTAAQMLTATAVRLIQNAAAQGVSCHELQIDFDCAESKLTGYRTWVETIRAAVQREFSSSTSNAPKLVITALPAWLRQPAFPQLASAADAYVLQVHSLERPRDVRAPFTLCDPAAAKRAVAQASQVGVPFRVALPTYGYFVGFDRDGKFIGLAADGPSIQWPAGTQVREVRSDPCVMADLVSFFETNRPANLSGVIWYRLPTESDTLNWRFSTLGVVMACRVPQADLKVESRSNEPGLAELYLRNAGSADFQGKTAVRVRISDARVLASDAVGGFDLEKTGSNSWVFRSPQQFLRAGDERQIGWLRTNRKAEVELEKLEQ